MKIESRGPRPPAAAAGMPGCRVWTASFALAACALVAALPAAALPAPAAPSGTSGAAPVVFATRVTTDAAGALPPVADTVAQGVARAYLQAVHRRDWATATQLVHPAALGRFKGAFVLLAAGDTGKMLVTDLFQLPDIEALERMPERQLYQRFMERVGSGAAGGAAATPEAQVDMLGTVAESDTLRHIVYRITMTVDGAPLPAVGVLTARRDGAEWKVELAAEVDAMIAGIRRGMAREQ
jgi:hypothetical protein